VVGRGGCGEGGGAGGFRRLSCGPGGFGLGSGLVGFDGGLGCCCATNPLRLVVPGRGTPLNAIMKTTRLATSVRRTFSILATTDVTFAGAMPPSGLQANPKRSGPIARPTDPRRRPKMSPSEDASDLALTRVARTRTLRRL
jgi:hypothetical protein